MKTEKTRARVYRFDTMLFSFCRGHERDLTNKDRFSIELGEVFDEILADLDYARYIPDHQIHETLHRESSCTNPANFHIHTLNLEIMFHAL